MNTAQPMYEWNAIPWRKLERNVFKLQKRIYQASQRGDSQQVRRLQRLLIKSWSAKALAVRRVTQDNTGKKTGLPLWAEISHREVGSPNYTACS